MKPRITVLTLAVDDLARSVQFYRDGLGFNTPGIVGASGAHDSHLFQMNFFDAPVEDRARFTPQDLVGACYERDIWNVLFDEGSLRPEFFDLSSGFAGDMVQKLVNYGIRAGVVIPDMTTYSEAFRDFAWESDRSGPIRFFRTRTDAVAWLSRA